VVQTYGSFFFWNQIWNNVGGSHALAEHSVSISPSATLRGGWQVGGGHAQLFRIRSRALYEIDHSAISRCADRGDRYRAFVVPPPEKNEWGGSLRMTTPTFRHFSGAASITQSQVPIFREAAPGTSSRIDGALDLRPTNAVRSSLSFSRSHRA